MLVLWLLAYGSCR